MQANRSLMLAYAATHHFHHQEIQCPSMTEKKNCTLNETFSNPIERKGREAKKEVTHSYNSTAVGVGVLLGSTSTCRHRYRPLTHWLIFPIFYANVCLQLFDNAKLTQFFYFPDSGRQSDLTSHCTLLTRFYSLAPTSLLLWFSQHYIDYCCDYFSEIIKLHSLNFSHKLIFLMISSLLISLIISLHNSNNFTPQYLFS